MRNKECFDLNPDLHFLYLAVLTPGLNGKLTSILQSKIFHLKLNKRRTRPTKATNNEAILPSANSTKLSADNSMGASRTDQRRPHMPCERTHLHKVARKIVVIR